MKILKNSFVLIGELVILIVALSWFRNCNNSNGDCHEPIIAALGSSFPLIIGVFLRTVDLFERSVIQKYCERLYKELKYLHLPLVSAQTQKGNEPKFLLTRSIPISNIYIDLPLKIVTQPESKLYQKKYTLINFKEKTTKVLNSINWFFIRKHKSSNSSFSSTYNTKNETRTTGNSTTARSVYEVLDKGKKIIIVSERGCGKSTLLQNLAYTYSFNIAEPKKAKEELNSNVPNIQCVPIIIRCGNLNLNSSTSFSSILKKHISERHIDEEKLTEFNEKIFTELNRGNLLILIDGVDEIQELNLKKQFCVELNHFIQTYPKNTFIVTCIENTFTSISRYFGNYFEIVKILKLGSHHKRMFIQQWSQNIEYRAESIEDLHNTIVTSRNLEGLTNNIQALSLIIQLPNINSLVQVNFATVLREIINLLIKKSEIQLKESISINEVTINLSEIAILIAENKISIIEESELIRIISISNQQAVTDSIYKPHSPHLLLKVFEKNMGILEVAYKELDSSGIERTFYKFSHPTFQDFFRVQAMMKRLDMGEVLSQLGMPDKLENDGKISINTSPIIDINPSSMSKLVFSELPPEKAEEILLTILHPQTYLGTEKSKERVILSANLLATAPLVSKKIASKVIDSLLESINPNVDGKGMTIKTPLDEAVYNLLHSPWSDEFEFSLFEAFINSLGGRRTAIGSIISVEIIGEFTDLKSISIQSCCDLFHSQRNESEANQVYARLKLMSIAFDKHQSNNSTYFDSPDTKNIYDLLLDFTTASEAVQMSSIWALGWILNARENQYLPKVKLTGDHIAILMEYLSNADNDSRGLYWAALCLSRYGPVQLQPDWIYEWATVADCQRHHSGLSLPIKYKIKTIDKIETLLKHVLATSYHSLAKEGVAMTLGRFGYYYSVASPIYFKIFNNSTYSKATRQEALSYLVQIKDKTIALQIYSIYKSAFTQKQEFKLNYTYLALLAIGNIEVLKELISQGITDLYEVGSMHPAFFVLKTTNNKTNARKLLNELKGSNNSEVRALAKISLMDFTGQSKVKVIQTVLTQLNPEEFNTGASGELINEVVCVLLVRGENLDGGDIFAYVAVRADRLQEFMEAQKSGTFYPEDYGVIIESGGGEPPKEIRDKMEDEYGFDHSGMLYL